MKKRLYKDDTDRMVCGVCSGVAQFFGIDPTLVRVVWVILILAFTFGFWLYLILAIILPPKSLVMARAQQQQQQRAKESGEAFQDVNDPGGGFDIAGAQDVEVKKTDSSRQDGSR